MSLLEKPKTENKKCEKHERNSERGYSKIVSCACVEMLTGRDEFVEFIGTLETRSFCFVQNLINGEQNKLLASVKIVDRNFFFFIFMMLNIIDNIPTL